MSKYFKRPFEILLNQKKIHVGETLTLYANPNNTDCFGTVKEDGIEVNGITYNPTSGACHLLNKIGYYFPVNGWLIWHNQAGQSLTSLYKECLGLHEPPGRDDKIFQ